MAKKAKTKLPKRGTEKWNHLVAIVAQGLCVEWSDFILPAVDAFLHGNDWRIGKAYYDPDPEDDSGHDFTYDVVGYLIEKPLTRWPEEDELG